MGTLVRSKSWEMRYSNYIFLSINLNLWIHKSWIKLSLHIHYTLPLQISTMNIDYVVSTAEAELNPAPTTPTFFQLLNTETGARSRKAQEEEKM
jgi:hypothetical protein